MKGELHISAREATACTYLPDDISIRISLVLRLGFKIVNIFLFVSCKIRISSGTIRNFWPFFAITCAWKSFILTSVSTIYSSFTRKARIYIRRRQSLMRTIGFQMMSHCSTMQHRGSLRLWKFSADKLQAHLLTERVKLFNRGSANGDLLSIPE
jgi:hypothetical protein